MTKTKTISGFTSNGQKAWQSSVTVRATKDEVGKTISFEDGERMIGVPVEEIEDLLKWLVK